MWIELSKIGQVQLCGEGKVWSGGGDKKGTYFDFVVAFQHQTSSFVWWGGKGWGKKGIPLALICMKLS